MACFDRSSPALKEVLFKIYRSLTLMLMKMDSANKSMEIDERICEFGAVEYHIKSSISDPFITYLSVSTPLLDQELLDATQIFSDRLLKTRRLHKDAVEITDPAKEGYQVTMKLDFSKIQNLKDPSKIVAEISTVRAMILSYQLREILRKVNSNDAALQGIMCKPIKLVYRPTEAFFVVKQPEKITTVFPMNFKEDSDVVIATAFFQELIDVGNSEAWEKAPLCSWSPIPPPELRGETFEDLNTNSGFISIDITSNHVKGKKLDMVVWILMNFIPFVKYHLKCTRGFIHRRMRKRLNSLIQILHKTRSEEDEVDSDAQGCRYIKRLVRTSKTKILIRKCRNIAKKIKRARYSIQIRGCGHFRRRWLKFPKFSSSPKYTKME